MKRFRSGSGIIMMVIIMIAIIMIGIPGPAAREEDRRLEAFPGDAILAVYMATSDLVVSGSVVSNASTLVLIPQFPLYRFQFKVERILYGQAPVQDVIPISLQRHEAEAADRSPLLHEGTRCILFLQAVTTGGQVAYRSIDPWYGIQPFNSRMVAFIERLAATPKK
jgi:hypothetical protein